MIKIYGLEREPVTRGYRKLGLLKNGFWNRTSLFWVITQRIVIISYRLFGTTYQSRPHGFLNPEGVRTTTRCAKTQMSAVHSYLATESEIMQGVWKLYNSQNNSLIITV